MLLKRHSPRWLKPPIKPLAVASLLAYTAGAQSSIFLAIKAIDGTVTEPNYEGSIEVLSFAQGSAKTNLQDSPLANLIPVSITKRTDKSSVALADALVDQAHSLEEWTLSFVQDGTSPKTLLMTLELCDVYVSAYSGGATGGISSESAMELFSFTYGGFRLGTPEFDPNGMPTGGLKYTVPDSAKASCVVPGVPPSVDSDTDGLSNAQESILGTNPFHVDTDGDGLVDGSGGLFPVYPGSIDANGDGFVDGEADLGTNPTLLDTDGDTFSDGVEVAAGSDPLQSSSTPQGSFIPGDLNNDGAIDVADVLLGSELLRGSVALTQAYIQRGDVAPLVSGISSPDGVFDLGDLLIIQSWVLEP